ncbi:MAG: SRPBCC family protein [Tumebacillaceae bacterium]
MFSNEKQDFTLHLTHLFPGTCELVFQAWTNKEQLEMWFGPEGYSTEVQQLDVSVGGTYEFALKRPDGHVASLSGKYLEVHPNEKLVFTWRWSDWGQELEDTLVTVQFIDKGISTEVALTHENFAHQAAMEGHKFAWSSIVGESLRKYLA